MDLSFIIINYSLYRKFTSYRESAFLSPLLQHDTIILQCTFCGTGSDFLNEIANIFLIF